MILSYATINTQTLVIIVYWVNAATGILKIGMFGLIINIYV